MDWGIISRDQISTKIGFLHTHLRNGAHTHTEEIPQHFSWVDNTNKIGSNFRTITRQEEGNCFYSRHQMDSKYSNKQHRSQKTQNPASLFPPTAATHKHFQPRRTRMNKTPFVLCYREIQSTIFTCYLESSASNKTNICTVCAWTHRPRVNLSPGPHDSRCTSTNPELKACD